MITLNILDVKQDAEDFLYRCRQCKHKKYYIGSSFSKEFCYCFASEPLNTLARRILIHPEPEKFVIYFKELTIKKLGLPCNTFKLKE